MAKPVFIYCLKDPRNGDVRYIGQTNNLKRRFRKHITESSKGQNYLGNWLRSLKGKKPVLAILHEVAEHESWAEEERRYISCARAIGIKLVNATDGGEGVSGWIATPEQREANSASKRGVPKSPECRAAISAAKMGMPPTPETCAKISAATKGVPKSPETRSKMSDASKGVPKSPEHCAAMRRHTRSPEHCAALSVALTGQPSYHRSSEHRLAMSDAVKASWARRKAKFSPS